MIERWNQDQVLALAPDASSQKAARGISSPGKWSGAGATADAVWGECAGSGSKPYRACVDLSDPAYRCSCPSRKFPCKHALGLLLLWSADGVPAAEEPADWVAEWLGGRRGRAARAAEAAEAGTSRAAGAVEPGPADGRRAALRERRVTVGLSDLERWLADQIRQGIAGSRRHDQWDDLVKRLIDAQAPAVAGSLSRLGAVLDGDDWPARLLSEYALLHLLCVAHRRLSVPAGDGSGAGGGEGAGIADLAGPDGSGEAASAGPAGGAGHPVGGREASDEEVFRETAPAGLLERVRDRVGFPMTREEVLARGAVRDLWDVLGRRDEEHDRLIARRVWLRGRATGRAALVLSFAPVGQALDASLVTGTTIDADLAFYPGSAPLRAVVAARHDPARHDPAHHDAARHHVALAGPPPGSTVEQALDEVAEALAGDPWLDSWPLVLEGVTPAGNGSRLLAGPSGGLPLHPSAGTPWRLVATSGGHPLTVVAEWTPRGLRPLTTWDEEGRVIVL
ncbi:SWIM zinc finger family protein [Streptosporangium sp. NBC_01469]|uniref:SWIM zinc finger family protein n=1 Tax=Streptosporangium sp. NBC_01469 TaxID=2903898 RepID=UPI002E2864DD|nr:SWIM zinc finger family protein [Streptosporangium sp. NBC_01469]